MSLEDVKKVVKDKYGELVAGKRGESGCCSLPGTCSDSDVSDEKIVDYTMFRDSYEGLSGYVSEADFGLGCGIPTKFISIKSGDVLLDLGSGAGNDAFVASVLVGDEGKVIGLDMTKEMVDKANENKLKVGASNVEFRFGEIEDMPVDSASVDVVISNCVLNLVPDKRRAFAEIARVLKGGGIFSISDIVLRGSLPEGLKKSAELYAGCVSGAIERDDYLGIMRDLGFVDIEVKSVKPIEVPDEYLKDYLSTEEIEGYKSSSSSIESITVVGKKGVSSCC